MVTIVFPHSARNRQWMRQCKEPWEMRRESLPLWMRKSRRRRHT
jgi:hypothetical protein